MRLKSRKTILIVAVIVAGAVVVGGFPSLLTLYDVSVNTTGIGYEYRDVLGGSAANGGGDLLDTSAYVTSWKTGGLSEKIVLQGHYKGAYGYDLTPDFKEYWYKITLDVDSSEVKINGVTTKEWISPRYENNDLSNYYWTACEAVVLTLTNPCSGKIHAEMWGRVMDLNPWSADDGLLAVDEAYLRDGIGSVQVVTDVVEEGDYAKFFVETGYASTVKVDDPTDEGWSLVVHNPTGVAVFTKSIGDNFAGTVSWLVPEGSYKTTWDNVYRVVLRNELINQDDDWFFTVGQGMIDDIPKLPTFKILEGDAPYTPGEAITVRMSAEKTVYNINGFWVWVSYETVTGTTTDYIYEKKWYAATVTSTGGYADVSFTFSDTGFVRMEASAVDTMNLNSGISELKWEVYDPGEEPGGISALDINWQTMAIGIIILLAAIIVYARAPLPKPYNLVIMLAMIALAGYFIVTSIG